VQVANHPERATVDLDSFQPSMLEMRIDPHRYYDALRSASPIYYSAAADCWIVTGYQEVMEVLKDWRRFAVLPQSKRLELSPVILLSIDPPRHTPLRQLVGRGLTADSPEDLRASISDIVDRLLDDMLLMTDSDLITGLAHPLPVAVIGKLLGVPENRSVDLTVWSDAINDVMSFQTVGRPESEAPDAYRLVEQFADFLHDEIGIHRAAKTRTDDLISRFVEATVEGALTELELVSLVVFLMFAGHITTESLIGQACAILAESEELQERVAVDSDALRPFVDEVLRLHPPLHRAVRLTTEDVIIDNVTIPLHSKVILYLAAANRDPKYFINPHAFDLARPTRRHLTFGAGIHVCLGSFLGKLEAEIAVDRLLARGRIALLPDRPSVPRMNPGPYGLKSLPVRYKTVPSTSDSRK
jgi:cytochrome P450